MKSDQPASTGPESPSRAITWAKEMLHLALGTYIERSPTAASQVGGADSLPAEASRTADPDLVQLAPLELPDSRPRLELPKTPTRGRTGAVMAAIPPAGKAADPDLVQAPPPELPDNRPSLVLPKASTRDHDGTAIAALPIRPESMPTSPAAVQPTELGDLRPSLVTPFRSGAESRDR